MNNNGHDNKEQERKRGNERRKREMRNDSHSRSGTSEEPWFQLDEIILHGDRFITIHKLAIIKT